MSASLRHDKSPNENVDDEIEEGLGAFPFFLTVLFWSFLVRRE